MEPIYFDDARAWRSWLEKHHGKEQEIWVGYRKQGTGNANLSWPESVDEALCFGWIDGVRHRVDEAHYKIRFTPRKPRSNWSAVNVGRVAELSSQGKMHAAGLAAFAARTAERTYSYEQRDAAALTPEQERTLQANAAAHAWFQAQPPYYRKAAIHWVSSAKQPATRERRLAQLIECSAAGRTVPPLTRRP